MLTFLLESRPWQRGLHRLLFGLVTAAGLALGAQAGSTAQPPIAVTIDNGRLTLSAPDAKLDRLLRAIGAKAGFKVIIKGNLATPTYYTAMNGVPLERGIRRLVGGNTMVMVYEPDGDGNGRRRIAEVRVYGRKGTRAARAR